MSIIQYNENMGELPRIALCSIMLVLCVLMPIVLFAHELDGIRSEKTLRAVRANTPPKIDGVFDDEAWQHAPITTEFIQSDPNEGEPATEKTTVQIVYDDEAVYVGIMCYDNEPEKIVARLYRRDELNEEESDWVCVYFDPHHDHQTGNFFLVGPKGALKDGTIYNDEEFDSTWDGVWEAKTIIHDKGWTVEYKIPYHVLRYSQKEEYIWGTNVARRIDRKHEHDFWVMVPKKERGLVSRFGYLEGKSCLVSRLGHIEGIKGIHPSKHMEFLPFTLGQFTFEGESLANPDGLSSTSTPTSANARYIAIWCSGGSIVREAPYLRCGLSPGARPLTTRRSVRGIILGRVSKIQARIFS